LRPAFQTIRSITIAGNFIAAKRWSIKPTEETPVGTKIAKK